MKYKWRQILHRQRWSTMPCRPTLASWRTDKLMKVVISIIHTDSFTDESNNSVFIFSIALAKVANTLSEPK